MWLFWSFFETNLLLLERFCTIKQSCWFQNSCNPSIDFHDGASVFFKCVRGPGGPGLACNDCFVSEAFASVSEKSIYLPNGHLQRDQSIWFPVHKKENADSYFSYEMYTLYMNQETFGDRQIKL